MSDRSLAVDGGNSKTDLALVRDDGARARRSSAAPSSSPHHIGLDGCVELLDGLLSEAIAAAGLAATTGQSPTSAQVLLAGARPARARSARCTRRSPRAAGRAR